MEIYSTGTAQDGDTDAILKIAVCLADNFLMPLYNSCNEKNYFLYKACLAEILDWSHEFYEQYCHNGNAFDDLKSNEVHPDVLLIAWGDKRIKQFLLRNSKDLR